jgi:hypothetical protein
MINETAAEVIGANYDWNWYDTNNYFLTANVGNPCNYDLSEQKGHGITKALTKIPYNLDAEEPIYDIFEDLRFSVCLDQRDTENKKWQFNINNLRIPIYTSFCPRDGWIDLGDGTDATLLNSMINDCLALGDVLYWLDVYWIPGQHLKKSFLITDRKYVFRAGVLKNEEYHVNRLKTNITLAINDSLYLLRTDDYKFSKELYNCPKDVINLEKEKVRQLIIRGRASWPNKMEPQEIEEINSDIYSRDTFKQIRQNIIDWAKQQSWWDETDEFCQDAISGH